MLRLDRHTSAPSRIYHCPPRSRLPAWGRTAPESRQSPELDCWPSTPRCRAARSPREWSPQSRIPRQCRSFRARRRRRLANIFRPSGRLDGKAFHRRGRCIADWKVFRLSRTAGRSAACRRSHALREAARPCEPDKDDQGLRLRRSPISVRLCWRRSPGSWPVLRPEPPWPPPTAERAPSPRPASGSARSPRANCTRRPPASSRTCPPARRPERRRSTQTCRRGRPAPSCPSETDAACHQCGSDAVALAPPPALHRRSDVRGAVPLASARA